MTNGWIAVIGTNAVSNICISADVFQAIQDSFLDRTRECGGILGKTGAVISAFEFDEGQGSSCPLKYIPNVSHLNRCLLSWKARNIAFCGMIHTHTNGRHTLTDADIVYGRRILSAFARMNQLVLALYCDCTLHFFLLEKEGIPIELPYNIL